MKKQSKILRGIFYISVILLLFRDFLFKKEGNPFSDTSVFFQIMMGILFVTTIMALFFSTKKERKNAKTYRSNRKSSEITKRASDEFVFDEDYEIDPNEYK